VGADLHPRDRVQLARLRRCLGMRTLCTRGGDRVLMYGVASGRREGHVLEGGRDLDPDLGVRRVRL
jgi:hypothetical protein